MAFDLLRSNSLAAETEWTELYHRHVVDLRRLIARNVPPDAPVEDLVQEAFYQAYKSRDRVDTSNSVWPWLATLGHRVCVAWWRRRRPEGVPWGTEELADPSVIPGSDDHLNTIVRAEVVSSALARLSPRHRALLLGHEGNGLSHERLARFEGSSAKAVKSALSRARTHFRQQLGATGEVRWGLPVSVAAFRRWASRQQRMLPVAEGMGAWASAIVALGVVAALSVAPVGMRSQAPMGDESGQLLASAHNEVPVSAASPSITVTSKPDAPVAKRSRPRSYIDTAPPPDNPLAASDIRTRTGITQAPEGTWMTFEVGVDKPLVGGETEVGTSVRCDAGKVTAVECAVLRMLPVGDS